MKKQQSNFKLRDFSDRQKNILFWWEDLSKFKDLDIIIADGAVRSGKTVSMIVSFLDWSLRRFHNENFIIAGKSIGSLKRNVIDPLRQIVFSRGWRDNFNRSENYINIRDNTYYLFGANNESSQDVLQGLTASGAFADEIALYPKSFVDQMIARCSIEGSKIFCNCNPNNPYHYFKTDFIDMAKEKLIYYLHFTMDDNLTLSEKVKERYKRMYSGVFFRRYILGEWILADGIIYDMFDEDTHVIDTSIIDKREFIEYYLSIDYGTLNAFSCGLWGKRIHYVLNDKNKRVRKDKYYRLKEYYYSGRATGKRLDNEEYYKAIVELVGNREIETIVIDPSASSFIATIEKYDKFGITKAKNDKIEGITNTTTALNMQRIYIDNNCKDCIKEFHTYSWDEKSAEKGKESPIDVNNHAMDDLRYMVNTIIYGHEDETWEDDDDY